MLARVDWSLFFQPLAVLSVYPVAGNDMETASYSENAEALPLGKADMKWFVENVLNGMENAEDTRISLLAANLSDLPLVTIVAAEIDPLTSEGEALAAALTEAGVDVEHRLFDGVTHEFFGMAAGVPQATSAAGA